MSRRRIDSKYLVLLGLLAGGGPALAVPELFPVLSGRVGAFQLSARTTADLEGPAGLAGEVDFEEDLGIDDEARVAALAVEWQPARRHLFRFGWHRQTREGRETLAGGDIDFGEIRFPVGADVSARIEQTTWEVDWTWWLLRRERGALGLELGATVVDLTAEAGARLRLGGIVLERRESASTTAPVPTLGRSSPRTVACQMT